MYASRIFWRESKKICAPNYCASGVIWRREYATAFIKQRIMRHLAVFCVNKLTQFFNLKFARDRAIVYLPSSSTSIVQHLVHKERAMSDAELQEEEREVLLSIYDGDPAFKQLTPTTFQYKYGEDNDMKSFLLEISWGATYPTEKPTINMDTFYNKHIVEEVKDKVVSHIEAEAEQWLGSAMTYTLFQSVQEHYTDLVFTQPNSITDINSQASRLKIADENQQVEETIKKPKKEHLSKAQKRKQWNKADGKGERPRGWNWVDIVKHLSQTGPRSEQES